MSQRQEDYVDADKIEYCENEGERQQQEEEDDEDLATEYEEYDVDDEFPFLERCYEMETSENMEELCEEMGKLLTLKDKFVFNDLN
jgi:hypothetical protein